LPVCGECWSVELKIGEGTGRSRHKEKPREEEGGMREGRDAYLDGEEGEANAADPADDARRDGEKEGLLSGEPERRNDNRVKRR
jgi:hypothetical protein